MCCHKMDAEEKLAYDEYFFESIMELDVSILFLSKMGVVIVCVMVEWALKNDLDDAWLCLSIHDVRSVSCCSHTNFFFPTIERTENLD